MSRITRRVAAAIHYINEHAREQPSLSQLAQYMHLSPYHASACSVGGLE